MIENKSLKRRIVEISYNNHLSHLGSCLISVDIIKEIYDKKKPEDKFILSCGHAGLALYVTMEYSDPLHTNAERLLESCGIHPDRMLNVSHHDLPIDCSTGSLGQGLPIAVGMALADPNRKVYCLISDGEAMEGSIWESLRIIDELQIKNIEVHCNINGYGAYREIEMYVIGSKLKKFLPEIILHYTNLEGIPHLEESALNAHYKVLNENEYKDIMEVLK